MGRAGFGPALAANAQRSPRLASHAACLAGLRGTRDRYGMGCRFCGGAEAPPFGLASVTFCLQQTPLADYYYAQVVLVYAFPVRQRAEECR